MLLKHRGSDVNASEDAHVREKLSQAVRSIHDCDPVKRHLKERPVFKAGKTSMGRMKMSALTKTKRKKSAFEYSSK
jgi:hypothetical protein